MPTAATSRATRLKPPTTLIVKRGCAVARATRSSSIITRLARAVGGTSPTTSRTTDINRAESRDPLTSSFGFPVGNCVHGTNTCSAGSSPIEWNWMSSTTPTTWRHWTLSMSGSHSASPMAERSGHSARAVLSLTIATPVGFGASPMSCASLKRSSTPKVRPATRRMPMSAK